jgi:hypothetical protein
MMTGEQAVALKKAGSERYVLREIVPLTIWNETHRESF